MALEGGCSTCLKWFMIIWNFIILVLGLAIVGIGVWLVVDVDSGEYVDDLARNANLSFPINYSRVSDFSAFEAIAYILIAIGIIVTFVAFLGYCGAMRESQCLLISCFICLFIIFGILVGIGIFVYVKQDEIDVDKDKLEPLVKDILEDAVSKYYTDQPSREFMDAVQTKFSCCGAEKGEIDYEDRVPQSCLDDTSRKTPCLPAYYNYVVKNISMGLFFQNMTSATVGIALGVAGGLIGAMILTLLLCCAIRRSDGTHA